MMIRHSGLTDCKPQLALIRIELLMLRQLNEISERYQRNMDALLAANKREEV
jgi:hypothetical protein